MWPFSRFGKADIEGSRSQVLREIDALELPKDTVTKIRKMIIDGNSQTAALTRRIIRQPEGLPFLTDLMNQHLTAGVKNSQLQELNKTLKRQRGPGLLIPLRKK